MKPGRMAGFVVQSCTKDGVWLDHRSFKGILEAAAEDDFVEGVMLGQLGPRPFG